MPTTTEPTVLEQPPIPTPSPAEAEAVHRAASILTFMWIAHWCAGVYDLPLRLFLKNHLGLAAVGVASVMFATKMAWNIKPVFAWVCDTFPIVHLRRKPYIALGSGLAALGFAALILLQDRASTISVTLGAVNLGLVFASCALGGLMIEMGTRNGDLARLSSIRGTINYGVSIFVGPVGGFLAGYWIGWSWGVGLACSILAVTLISRIKEEQFVPSVTKPFELIVSQFKALFLHLNFWYAIVATILLTLAPGFGTMLLFYQQNVLKFAPQTIGNFGFLNGAFGILSGLACVYLSKHWSLKKLLIVSTLVGAIGTLAYLSYNSLGHAIVIESIGGFVGTPGTIVIFLIAGYAVPKGLEAVGYALIMALMNFCATISDIWGSYMSDHFGWNIHQLVWLNSGTTLLILALVPFMPVAILNRKDSA